jgi:hypothetical protein
MQKRDLPMSLAVVQNAVLQERRKIAAIVADIIANNVKCIRQSVLLVEKKLQYLSSQQATDQYTAVTVINHVHESAIGKIERDLPRILLLGRSSFL